MISVFVSLSRFFVCFEKSSVCDLVFCFDFSRPPDLNKAPLPSASSLLATSSLGLVFNNPYKVAENAKIASLEKHVKMVNLFDSTTHAAC